MVKRLILTLDNVILYVQEGLNGKDVAALTVEEMETELLLSRSYMPIVLIVFEEDSDYKLRS